MIPLRKNIAEMAGYVPGFQPEDEAAWIKLNTNENPYPPSPKVVEAILAEVGETAPPCANTPMRRAARRAGRRPSSTGLIPPG